MATVCNAIMIGAKDNDGSNAAAADRLGASVSSKFNSIAHVTDAGAWIAEHVVRPHVMAHARPFFGDAAEMKIQLEREEKAAASTTNERQQQLTMNEQLRREIKFVEEHEKELASAADVAAAVATRCVSTSLIVVAANDEHNNTAAASSSNGNCAAVFLFESAMEMIADAIHDASSSSSGGVLSHAEVTIVGENQQQQQLIDLLEAINNSKRDSEGGSAAVRVASSPLMGPIFEGASFTTLRGSAKPIPLKKLNATMMMGGSATAVAPSSSSSSVAPAAAEFVFRFRAPYSCSFSRIILVVAQLSSSSSGGPPGILESACLKSAAAAEQLSSPLASVVNICFSPNRTPAGDGDAIARVEQLATSSSRGNNNNDHAGAKFVVAPLNINRRGAEEAHVVKWLEQRCPPPATTAPCNSQQGRATTAKEPLSSSSKPVPVQRTSRRDQQAALHAEARSKVAVTNDSASSPKPSTATNQQHQQKRSSGSSPLQQRQTTSPSSAASPPSHGGGVMTTTYSQKKQQRELEKELQELIEAQTARDREAAFKIHDCTEKLHAARRELAATRSELLTEREASDALRQSVAALTHQLQIEEARRSVQVAADLEMADLRRIIEDLEKKAALRSETNAALGPITNCNRASSTSAAAAAEETQRMQQVQIDLQAERLKELEAQLKAQTAQISELKRQLLMQQQQGDTEGHQHHAAPPKASIAPSMVQRRATPISRRNPTPPRGARPVTPIQPGRAVTPVLVRRFPPSPFRRVASSSGGAKESTAENNNTVLVSARQHTPRGGGAVVPPRTASPSHTKAFVARSQFTKPTMSSQIRSTENGAAAPTTAKTTRPVIGAHKSHAVSVVVRPTKITPLQEKAPFASKNFVTTYRPTAMIRHFEWEHPELIAPN